MAGQTLATAWINIVPTMKGASKAIQAQLGGIDTSTAGRKLGASLSSSVIESAGSGLGKLGSVFSGIGKKALAGFTAAAGSVAVLGKAATDAYAEWEQAVGGVDTLFKDSSSTVQKYAAEAYKTAGVSASSYMNQVTSFAATLISNLGGDTAKAAELGNTAIVDMSDNANKMGTDIESIQQTYQSLSRGNYAMLDNLKLGYGGTKTELERLVADANKLAPTFGEAADMSADSFADVVRAIHIVQQNLGITGTTAREAATTIEGSVGSMKAAWNNWLAEVGKDNADMTTLTAQLAQSVMNVGQNVLPRAGQISAGVLQGLSSYIKSFGTEVPAPFTALASALDSTAGKLGTFSSGLSDALTKLAAGEITMSQFAATLKSLGLGQFVTQLATVATGIGTLIAVGGKAGTIANGIGSVSAVIGGLSGKLAPMGSALSSAGSLLANFAGRTKMAAGIIDANFGGIGTLLSSRLSSSFTSLSSTVGGLFDRSILLPLQTVGGKIGGVASTLAQPFAALGSQIGGWLSPITSGISTAFGGLGGQIGGALSNGLCAASMGVQTVIKTVFSPANFVAWFGFAAIIAALIAGLGALDAGMGGQLNAMISGLLAQLPGILAGVQKWVESTLPTLTATGAKLLTTVLNGITANMPQLMSVAVSTVTGLVSGLGTAAPTLIPAAVNLITSLVQGFASGLPSILQSGMNLLLGLLSGIMNALPNLIASAPTIILSLVTGFLQQLPQLLTTGVTMLLNLVNGIVNAIPNLIAAVPQIIFGLIGAILSNLPQIILTGFELIAKLAIGLLSAIPRLLAAVPTIFISMVRAFMSVDWLSIGRNIINGIGEGIRRFASILWNAAKSAASGALNAVKGLLGIHSPSRVFRDQVGVMISRGIAVGIANGEKEAVGAVGDVAGSVRNAWSANSNMFDADMRIGFQDDLSDYSKTARMNMTASLPDSTPRDGLTVKDMTAAFSAALQAMPNQQIVLDSGVVAGAVNRKLGVMAARGIA